MKKIHVFIGQPVCSQTGKIIYHHRRVAKRIAQKLRNRFGERRWVYRCDHCERFHLTSMTRQEYAAIRGL